MSVLGTHIFVGPLELVQGVLNFLCVFCLMLFCFVFFQTTGSEPLVLDCDLALTAFCLWNLDFWLSDSVFFRTCLLGSYLFRICNSGTFNLELFTTFVFWFSGFDLVITFELEASGSEQEAVLTFSYSDTKWVFRFSLSEQGFRITSLELPLMRQNPKLILKIINFND